MLPIAVRPAEDAAFAFMDARPIVFSEANQKIYQLNEIAGYIWCKLEERIPIETIAQGLASSGVKQGDAIQVVRQALRDWLDLALIDFDLKAATDFTLRKQLAGHTITIRASNEPLLRRLEPVFCSADSRAGGAEIVIEVAESPDGHVLFRANKGRVSMCSADELAPSIKACIIQQIIFQDQPKIALHAASLTLNGKGLLMCGEPGVGKSTLSLHLLHAGFRYAGDDVVLIAPDGSAEGIPFAPTVKPGAWKMISRLRGDVDGAVVHRRPDGIEVRYLPATDVHNGRFAINWIVFLDRADKAAARLTPLGQIETISRIIEGSFAADGKLSRKAFVVLKRLLSDAKSFVLTYSDAGEARDALMEICSVQA